MKNDNINNNIGGTNLGINSYKINKKVIKKTSFTSIGKSYLSFANNEIFKNHLLNETKKNEFLKIKNLNKIEKEKKDKRQNISLTFTTFKSIFIKNLSNKKIDKNKNKYNLNNKKKYTNKIKANYNSLNLTKENFNNLINCQNLTKMSSKNGKKFSKKKKLNSEINLSIKIKRKNKKDLLIGKKEKNKKYISNNITINMNNSSKLTNISSYGTSENNIKSKKILNEDKNKNDINIIKAKIYQKLDSVLKENEVQEYESKFLNYELGFSDKESSTKNYNIEKAIYKNNKEIFPNEQEKLIDEIEKIANELYNSEKTYKQKSYIENLYKGELNKNIDELKNGEKIKTIFSFEINIKKK